MKARTARLGTTRAAVTKPTTERPARDRDVQMPSGTQVNIATAIAAALSDTCWRTASHTSGWCASAYNNVCSKSIDGLRFLHAARRDPHIKNSVAMDLYLLFTT